MKSNNNEILIQRGESFAIDKIIVNKDGSPFVVSSELNNPYWLLTISGTRLNQPDSYTARWWLPVNNLKFASTNAIDLARFKDSRGVRLWHSFSELSSLPSGMVDGETITITDNNDAIYYFSDNLEEGYKYYDGLKYVTYVCRLIFTFNTSDTNKMLEKSYYYNINLVDGELATQAELEEFGALKRITYQRPILNSTKLTVLSSLQGGMYD